MSFKKAFSALVTAVLTMILMSFVCFADSEKPSFSSDLSLVSRSYDEETMMYFYAFPDGAKFYASEVLSDSENFTSILLVGTEEDDISILVNSANGFLEQSQEVFLTEDGVYEVTISHELRNASGSVQARFAVEIGEQSAAPAETVISGRVSLENTDGETFRHTFINGEIFETNVLDGETVSFMPKLSVPENVVCSMTRDGKICSLSTSGLITEDGAYKIDFTCYGSDGRLEKRYFSFNFFSKPTNRLGIFQAPFGFELTRITLNGKDVPVTERNFADLNGEGEYFIEYKNGNTTRSVKLSRDITPPVLYFNGTTDVIFSERVFVTSDTECSIRVTKNGQISSSTTELLGAGIYRITAADAAGNTTSARVEIKAVSAINPLDFVIIFGVLVVGGVVYFFIQRNRKMTVR